jgi:uncharacterized protein (DUF486 family)
MWYKHLQEFTLWFPKKILGMIAMAGNLKKHLSVVITTTIVSVVVTIYLKNGVIFQDFPSNFLVWK